MARVVAQPQWIGPFHSARACASTSARKPAGRALGVTTSTDTLSSRERQILDMLEQGHPASKVGAHLRISPRTVENHRAQILQKLNLGNTTQLIRQVAVLDSLRASGILD